MIQLVTTEHEETLVINSMYRMVTYIFKRVVVHVGTNDATLSWLLQNAVFKARSIWFNDAWLGTELSTKSCTIYTSVQLLPTKTIASVYMCN